MPRPSSMDFIFPWLIYLLSWLRIQEDKDRDLCCVLNIVPANEGMSYIVSSLLYHTPALEGTVSCPLLNVINTYFRFGFVLLTYNASVQSYYYFSVFPKPCVLLTQLQLLLSKNHNVQ